MGEGFFRQSRRFDAGILCVFQGEATQSGGKRPAQTAFNACEYRFSNHSPRVLGHNMEMAVRSKDTSKKVLE